MALMSAYILLLTAAVIFALFTAAAKHDEPLARGAVALLVNWIIGMAISIGGWTDAWPVNIPLDAITAGVVLLRPAAKWQAALAVTYCVQIIMHIGYGTRLTLGMGADAMEYYNQLTGVAFLQLAILGGWSIDLWGRGAFDRRPDRGEADLDASTSRVDET